jgi:hypothetical protein
MGLPKKPNARHSTPKFRGQNLKKFDFEIPGQVYNDEKNKSSF